MKDDEEIALEFSDQTIKFTSSTPTTQQYKFVHYGDFKVTSPKIIREKISPTLIETKGDIKAVLKQVGEVRVIDDDTPIYVSIKDSKTSEANESIKGKLILNRALKDGEYLKVDIGEDIVEFGSGESSKDFTASKWDDDKISQEDREFYISPSSISSNATVYVKSAKDKFVIIDNDKDGEDVEDIDPIIIDLNKNKITSTKLNNTTYFDHDNNNFKEASSWLDKGDAFLALDKNSNGLIDNGNELFGNHTISNTSFKYTNNKAINGYEALKAYDLNGDNVIDSKDEIYDKLVLWKDSNQNAITDKGELIKLKDSGIVSIDLNYKQTLMKMATL